jgi:hypothetical protein
MGRSCKDSQGKNYGSFRLNDSNTAWLSFGTGIEKISFKNNNGFIANYRLYHNYLPVNLAIGPRYSRGEEDPCCGRVYYQDYLVTEAEELQYEPIGDGFSTILRRSQEKAYYFDSANIVHMVGRSENLNLSHSSGNFLVNVDTSFSSASQNYHSSLILSGKTFYHVYEVIDTLASPPHILIKRTYFSFNDGVIGYQLTNNEQWVRE